MKRIDLFARRIILLFIGIACGLSSIAVFAASQGALKKPVIGIILNDEQAGWLAAGKAPARFCCAAIEKAGGTVAYLTVRQDEATRQTTFARLQGLLIPGGDDISPDFYGAQPDPKLEIVDLPMDRLEMALLRQAREKGLPVLGICRGCQLINVFCGGTLCQDIPTRFHGKKAVDHRRKQGEKTLKCPHVIDILPGSLLARCTGTTRLEVNSYHHQAAERLGKELRATAWSEDSLIEAVEGGGKTFFLGVQFHPERDYPGDARFEGIFKAFVQAAAQR